jgi:hypothetical protein
VNELIINNLSSGNHSIAIEDNYENLRTQSFNIAAVPAPVTISTSITPPTIYGGNNGRVIVTGSGGTTPYQYSKDGSSYQSSRIFVNLSSGSITFYVKDANGCEASATVPIQEGRQFTVTSTTPVAPTCYSGNDGKCTIQLSSLQGTLSVSGLQGYPTEISGNVITISGLETGYYLLNITETSGGTQYTIQEDFKIPEKLSITINTVITPVSGKGSATGAIAVEVSGGNSGTYRVVLLDEQGNLLQEKSTASYCVFDGLDGASAGGGKLYTVKVYDSKNCTAEISERIPEPDTALNLTATLTSPISCHGSSDAAIDISASGGWSDYLYSRDSTVWNTVTTFSNLSSGNYRFFVKDKYNGVANVSLTVFNPQPLRLSSENVVNVDCYGAASGSIRFKASGGTFPYTLTPVVGTIATRIENGDTLITVSGLRAGNYTFTLTDSHNCVVRSEALTIGEPTQLSVAIPNVEQPSCGWENGVFSALASGGTSPYRYELTKNGASAAQSQTSGEAVTFNNLSSGVYRVTVTDSHGCQVQSELVTLNLYTSPSITSATVEDVCCFDQSNGKITLTAQRGTVGIAYFTLTNTVTQVITQSSTGIFENLAAGDYSLFVYDENGCRSQNAYPATVNQPKVLIIETENILPAIYKGNNDGKIRFRIDGGNTGNVVVSLKNTDNQVIESLSAVRGFGPEPSAPAGDYTMHATDKKGCTFETSTLEINEPADSLRLIVTETKDALCKSQTGSIHVEGAGGWGEYRYKRAADGQFSPLNRFENLYPGTYHITVIDRMGATATQSVTVYEPQDSLKAEIAAILLPTCDDNGALSISLSGGTAPYKLFSKNGNDTLFVNNPETVQWTSIKSGALLLHLADANDCKFELETVIPDTLLLRIERFIVVPPDVPQGENGSIEAKISGGANPVIFFWQKIGDNRVFPNNPLITDLSGGFYKLQVSDGNGCSIQQTVYLPDPNDLSLEVVELVDETSVNAANGRAVLFADASLAAVRLINPDADYVDYPASAVNSNFHISNDTIYLNHLANGKWSVVGTTATGENAVAEFVIKPYLAFAFGNIELVPATAPNAADGSIRLEVTGGAGENEFIWTDERGNILSATSDEYSSQLTGLPAGAYTLTVTDRFNNQLSKEIELQEPAAALQLNVYEQRNQSCHANTDAYIILSATGGWGDYRVAHYRQPAVNNLEYSNSTVYSDLETGEHYFYAVDKYGTEAQISITITEPELLRANVANISHVSCKGEENGQIVFSISGGTAPYYFREIGIGVWERGNTATRLAAGEYTFEFTDSLQCSSPDRLTVIVTEPDSLLLDSVRVSHTLCGEDNGEITVSFKGGTRPYVYEWRDPDNSIIGTDSIIINLKQNTLYRLIVTDANDCTQSLEQLIHGSKRPRIVSVETADVLCYGGATGSARASAVDAGEPFAPYSLAWSNGATGDVAENLPVGQHHVTVTDSNSCSTTYYFDIHQPDSLFLRISDYKNPHCYSYSDGFIHTETYGGAGDYTYLWSNDATTPNIDNITKGDYWVRVTDKNGCSFQTSFVLTEPPYLSVNLGEDIIMCPGNTHVLDGGSYASYRWFTDQNDSIFNERYLSVSEAGHYRLEARTPDGCPVWGDISVEIGNNALQADLLLASEAEVGDTLYIFEISNLPVDTIIWEYDSVAFTRIYSDDEVYNSPYMLLLHCNETGFYNIGLQAFSGGCYSPAVKQLEVLVKSDEDDEDAWELEPMIKSLAVYPSPNDGNFTVEIELRETADVRLDLFDVSSGIAVNNRTEHGQDYYLLNYSLNGLHTGVYALIVTAGNERRQIKIVITN